MITILEINLSGILMQITIENNQGKNMSFTKKVWILPLKLHFKKKKID